MKLIYDYIDFSIKEYFKPCHELCKDLDTRIRIKDKKISLAFKRAKKDKKTKFRHKNNAIHE